jgi:hypothetical protein
LFVVLISQPLPYVRSQFANPALQDAIWQPPPLHVEVAFGAEQMWPQPPQLFVSFEVLTSQPSEKFALQSRKPALQVIPHIVPLHVGVEFG